ncbi:glycosyl transferase [Noviherbaspirillum aridicola]|uniref:Capsular polysaccharide biosynthesis protein n=1 Tax=Noviherbaspirillum aridicola TaxID=2849687 RepID=A0ABQ4Q7U9_9BURK|nr:glycosyl transferase [Noviherbaspirillum aridicola]GIZ52855.1 capsular polysaccharide biosynthesis protein [Noviherbaspirillum aridicola]
MNTTRKHVLAVASGGGHWVQLLRLRPAFVDSDVTYMTTNAAYARDVDASLITVADANLKEKLRLLRMFFEVLVHVARLRPDIVVSTGAAPGFAAILFGRLFGARTVWIDSIANSEQLSVSGKYARRYADVWLTQWAHLSQPAGPQYWGGVL